MLVILVDFMLYMCHLWVSLEFKSRHAPKCEEILKPSGLKNLVIFLNLVSISTHGKFWVHRKYTRKYDNNVVPINVVYRPLPINISEGLWYHTFAPNNKEFLYSAFFCNFVSLSNIVTGTNYIDFQLIYGKDLIRCFLLQEFSLYKMIIQRLLNHQINNSYGTFHEQEYNGWSTPHTKQSISPVKVNFPASFMNQHPVSVELILTNDLVLIWP